MAKTVAVPTALLKKMSRAAKALQELEEDFEDLLLSAAPGFLSKMRKARAEHLAGKTKPVRA